MKYQEFHIKDFRAGYDSNSSPETQPDNSIGLGSFDMDLGVGGALQTRRGYSKLLTDADATWSDEGSDGVQETLGLHEFIDPSNVRCLVRIARATANSNTASLFSSGDVCIEYNTADFPDTISATGWTLESSGGNAVTLGNVGTAEQFVDFASYKARLYVACPGITSLGYLSYSSGFSVTTVTDNTSGTSGISKPTSIEAWYDRIWAVMDESVDDGSYLYWTDTDGDAFGADNYTLISGEGAITGLARAGRNMLLFKKGQTFILSGGDDPAANLRIETLSREVGCIARRSIVVVEGGVYWLSDRGVMYFDGRQIQLISENIGCEFDDVDRTKAGRIHAVHHAAGDQVAFFLPYAQTTGSVGYGEGEYGTDYGNGDYIMRALVWDYSAGAWCPPFTNQDFWVSCAYTNSVTTSGVPEEIVVVGRPEAYDDHIMHWYNGTDDDGTEISGSAVLKPLDLGDPGLIKIVRKIYSQIGEQGAGTTVRIELFDNYDTIDDTTDTPQSVIVRTTTEGTYAKPKDIQERHTCGLRSKHLTLRVTLAGQAVLNGLVALYSVKGRRS